MDEIKMSIEEFKERVVEQLKDTYAPHKNESFLRKCVDDDYFRPEIEDGYNHRLGVEYGIGYAANNIGMCI